MTSRPQAIAVVREALGQPMLSEARALEVFRAVLEAVAELVAAQEKRDHEVLGESYDAFEMVRSAIIAELAPVALLSPPPDSRRNENAYRADDEPHGDPCPIND